MSLTPTDIKKIAYLARLNINEEDVASYAEKLSHILSLIEQMNEIDTSDVEPLSHPLELSQRFRKDKVIEKDNREQYQKKIAPQTEAGLYLVPKVIE